MSAAASAGIASPCVQVCDLDPRTGWCVGCLRTIDEIATWGALVDADKRAVLARLPERREALHGDLTSVTPPQAGEGARA